MAIKKNFKLILCNREKVNLFYYNHCIILKKRLQGSKERSNETTDLENLIHAMKSVESSVVNVAYEEKKNELIGIFFSR